MGGIGKNIRIWAAWLLCLCVLTGPFYMQSVAEEQAAESGELLVWLKSLGATERLSLTLDGSYSVDGDAGFRFDRGATLTVSALDGHLLLYIGGLTLDMGASFQLTRHETEGNNGIYIEGSQRGNIYNGDLTLRAADGGVKAVLSIDIEEYLYGVVPYEMSDSFPLEALKAQAVAARTYALNRRLQREKSEYHLVDTTADQVFMGYDASYQNAVIAVDATKGICGLYKGAYASCFYTASNGGQTALPGDIFSGEGDYGYLDIRDDPYDVENPKSIVKSLSFRSDASDLPEALREMLAAALSEQMAALGYSDETGDIEIAEILAIEPCDPKFRAEYKMYENLRFTLRVRGRPLVPVYEKLTLRDYIDAGRAGRKAEAAITGWELGEAALLDGELRATLTVYDQIKDQLSLSINSSDYELISVRRSEAEAAGICDYAIELRRYGHGVGMSQRGAQWMAAQYGADFMAILAFYYPGLSFEARSFEKATRAPLGSASTGAGIARARTTPAPTSAPLPALSAGEYYAEAALSTAWSTLNVRGQPSTSAAVVGELRNGEQMIVMDKASDGWLYIKTATLTGYVSADYVTITKE